MEATPIAPGSLLFQKYAKAAKSAGIASCVFAILVNAGIVLQPRQLQFTAACLSCDEPDGPTEVGFGGARGGGKSHAGLSQLTLDCLRFDGLTCLLLRKVGKANRENFGELRRKVLRGVPTIWKQQEGVLVFPNGSKIILGHFQRESDIDAYLGLEYDVILVEEATTLTSAKVKAIKTCMRTSKAGWRPRMYYTTNPGNVGHAWFKALFIARNKPTTTRFVPATVDDNACINPEYKAQLDTLTGWQLRAWRYGDWDIAAGQFFTTFRATIDGAYHHVLPSFKTPKHWVYWCALDYGWTHYTVVHLFARDGDGNVYVIDEHAARRWQPKQHADAIKAMLARHGLTVSRLWKFVAGHDVFSPRDDGLTIEDAYKAQGITLTPASIDRINGAGEILTCLGDPEQPARLPASIFFFDNCVRLIECLPGLEHDPHKPEAPLKWDTDDDGNGGDDAYDSFRYGLQEARRPQAVGVFVGGERDDVTGGLR